MLNSIHSKFKYRSQSKIRFYLFYLRTYLVYILRVQIKTVQALVLIAACKLTESMNILFYSSKSSIFWPDGIVNLKKYICTGKKINLYRKLCNRTG